MRKFFQQSKAMLAGAFKGITTFYEISLFKIFLLDKKEALALIASSAVYGTALGIATSFLPPFASLVASIAALALIPVGVGAIASVIRAVRNIFGNKGVYDSPLEQAVEAGMKATNASLAADKLPRMYNLEHATEYRQVKHSLNNGFTLSNLSKLLRSRATFDETNLQELSKSEKVLRICNGGR